MLRRFLEIVKGIEKDEQVFDELVPEFPPMLDLIPVAFGIVALIAGGVASGGDAPVLSVARWLAGAAFLGAVSDGMLLGHWYLVQPGLPRAPLLELVRWVGYTWPVEVLLFLVPVGMVSVFNGTIDDAYGGMLGWFWAASAITTIVLVGVTRVRRGHGGHRVVVFGHPHGVWHRPGRSGPAVGCLAAVG